MDGAHTFCVLNENVRYGILLKRGPLRWLLFESLRSFSWASKKEIVIILCFFC